MLFTIIFGAAGCRCRLLLPFAVAAVAAGWPDRSSSGSGRGQLSATMVQSAKTQIGTILVGRRWWWIDRMVGWSPI